MKIELTYEQEDQVIIKGLKRDIKFLIGNNLYEDPFLAALLRVLKNYLAPSEFDTFVRKNDL